MRVILLCAGYATRLYPLTIDCPKPLLPINGRPILEWTLEGVQGVRNVEAVYVVTNHKFAPHFQKWAGGGQFPWPLDVIDDGTTSNENRLGAIGDLHFVVHQKKIGSEDLLVIAGDNFFDFDLPAFVKSALAKRPQAVIAVYDVQDRTLARSYGLIRRDKSGKVIEFLEKPENPPTTLASCGLYWLPRETRLSLDKYLADGHNPDQPGHYMRWLADQGKLYSVSLAGQWFDIGDKTSYEKANALFSQSNLKSKEESL